MSAENPEAKWNPAFDVPAFPASTNQDTGNLGVWRIEGGMSLRDWFAGQTLGFMILAAKGIGEPVPSVSEFAHAAYQFADAMLAERSKS